MRSSIEPLRIRRFRALWAASVVSNIGSFLQTVAAAWVMYELTGSPLWVGLMAASSTLPLLFLALPAGAIADLFDRRRILLVSQGLMGASATAMTVLAILDVVTPGMLLALGLALGVGFAVNLPAWQALVPDLVPRDLVPSAVALNSAAFNVARALGPALGGIIVATAGPGLAFGLNACSYLGVVAVLLTFRSGQWDVDDPEPVASAIATGLRFARFTPGFRRVLTIAGGFAITSSVVQSLLPNVTADQLGGGATLFGTLLGSMGVGALLGALSRELALKRVGRHMVAASMAGFGIAGVVVGISSLPPLTAAAMVVAGVFWVWALSTLNATAQLMAPRWVRGRAMSLYTLSFVGLLPVGSIIGGVIGARIGAAGSVLVLSLGAILVGFAGLRFGIPGLGEVVSTEPPADWDLTPHEVHLEGGPVMIFNTWIIDEADLAEFFEAMDRLRLVRLSTGAYRWRLYRNAGDPHRMTEVMLLASWDAHLRQHRRIDRGAAEVISRANEFDRSGGPVTQHLVAIEVAEAHLRPEWEALVAVHRDLHHADGSITLGADDVTIAP